MRNTRNTGTMMKIQENKQIEVSRFSGLSGYRDISHFTTTRHGGVSTGTYASMNPGVYTEDDPGFIRKNLELLSDAVGISLENMVIPHQTHEDRVLAIDASTGNPSPSSMFNISQVSINEAFSPLLGMDVTKWKRSQLVRSVVYPLQVDVVKFLPLSSVLLYSSY